MKRLILIVVLCGLSTGSFAHLGSSGFAINSPKKIFDIRDFGAVGDSSTLNTKAIQDAIDACTANGGGTVWVPAGNYVIGTIELKSNVTLSLDYGASLLGSHDRTDYPIHNLRPAREGNAECLFYAEDATNIRFEGLGVIDGRGYPEVFPKSSGPGGKDNRPRLIRFENCSNLTFSGLTYKNPAFWGIHLVDCKGVHFNGVTVQFRDNGSNNDGLDLDGCQNVLIENSDINAGDDAICLKSSLNPCRNFVIRNCIVSSNTAPVKFGTSSYGGFIDVDITNCYFYDSPMGAIKLQSVDGGRLENVNISRITMEGVGSPVFIRLGKRGRVYAESKIEEEKTKERIGTIKNIKISDIKATVEVLRHQRGVDTTGVEVPPEETTDREWAKAGPIMITGIPGHNIENVTLENIDISYPGGLPPEKINMEIPEDEDRYPEQFFFGVLPAWGAYIRHAEDIQFKNVNMTKRSNDKREMIVTEDVEGFVNQ
ncbi:MAG: glycoside hydrolase family 28 protein [Cyclobacteriaceae bacterium]